MTQRVGNWLLWCSIALNLGAVGLASVVPGPNKKCVVTPVFGFGHDCNCDGAPAANNFTSCEISHVTMGQNMVTDFQCIQMNGINCADVQASCGRQYSCAVASGACNAMGRLCTLKVPNINCNEQFGCQ